MLKPIVLNFDNHLLKHMPFQVRKVRPTPLVGSHIVAVSGDMLTELGLTKDDLHQTNFVEVFSGKALPEGGCHHAQVYAGHQFGQFVPQLGDGRAISLGEVKGSEFLRWDVQLKGAGQTPFSRMGDGRAVLRSCVREFLASEAMAALDIPTTRALSIIGSSQDVYREQVEKGAVMTRLAPSYIRFGHFEYWFHHGKKSELNQLADYCLATYFPECLTEEKPHLAMLQKIVQSTAELIALWQVHGFAHGVMNTDNMSILGLTIDYGPFGFLDDYDPKFICNHSDHTGRYAFEQQPSIGLWNLNALAVTFSDWLSVQEITQTLSQYEPIFVRHYLQLMQKKLGFSHWQEDDQYVLGEWLNLLTKHKADYTLSFRQLNQVFVKDSENEHCQVLLSQFSGDSAAISWLNKYRQRLLEDEFADKARHQLQNQYNAKYILRNYLAQQVIEEAEQGNYQMLNELQKVLKAPFDEQPDFEKYAIQSPDWGKSLEISCSS
ncbi:YdiU family protein [Thalassotalea sp. M1531]|uniref:Protein nucleotidyltransferase YdiU n=1 Tax=Thalassotalea algicola TaxID=2716224 RepID=A0A7Y0LA86_9GAMM|nr:YdiU family protein [Thalassotalea algicola]NMP30637.1 YdiU family protein [Thalassotalea algicola]